jgi:apolipoprotein N-acyltransferase
MDVGILLIPAAVLGLAVLTLLIVLVARALARWLAEDPPDG